MLKYMGFEEDMNVINEMKKRYYKLYFKTNKEEKAKNNPLQLNQAEHGTVNSGVTGSIPVGGVDKNSILSYTTSCVEEVCRESNLPLCGISLEAKLKVSNLSSPVRFWYSAFGLSEYPKNKMSINTLVTQL